MVPQYVSLAIDVNVVIKINCTLPRLFYGTFMIANESFTQVV